VIYLDTSWLVKLYVEEEDSAAVRKIVAADDDVLVSDLAYVEFHSAIERRRRERKLVPRAAAGLVTRFRDDWKKRDRLALSHDVVVRAAELVATHPLRSLDALHLASALIFAAGAPEKPQFGAKDARLVAAAKAEGLVTLQTT